MHRNGSSLALRVLLMVVQMHCCTQGRFPVEIEHSTDAYVAASSLLMLLLVSATCTTGVAQSACSVNCSHCSLLQYFMWGMVCCCQNRFCNFAWYCCHRVKAVVASYYRWEFPHLAFMHSTVMRSSWMYGAVFIFKAIFVLCSYQFWYNMMHV